MCSSRIFPIMDLCVSMRHLCDFWLIGCSSNLSFLTFLISGIVLSAPLCSSPRVPWFYAQLLSPFISPFIHFLHHTSWSTIPNNPLPFCYFLTYLLDPISPLANFLQCKWLHNVIPFVNGRIGIEPNDLLITRKVLLIISSGIVKWFSNKELASLERWSSPLGKKGGWGYTKPYIINPSHFSEIDAKNVWFPASHVDISERRKREHREDRFFQNLMSMCNRGRLGNNSKIIDET